MTQSVISLSTPAPAAATRPAVALSDLDDEGPTARDLAALVAQSTLAGPSVPALVTAGSGHHTITDSPDRTGRRAGAVAGVDVLAVARAEALFAARVPAEPLSRDAATSAIRAAMRALGGVRGCACVVAAEFGDHPDSAVVRMRWAKATVAAVFGPEVDR